MTEKNILLILKIIVVAAMGLAFYNAIIAGFIVIAVALIASIGAARSGQVVISLGLILMMGLIGGHMMNVYY